MSRAATLSATLGRDYAVLLSPLLSVTREHLSEGLSLFERHAALGAFGAVLAAAAIATDATALVSADSAFADVAAVPHVVPDAAGVAGLLES